MVLAYYVIICVLSLMCCSAFYFIKRSYFSTRYTMIFLLAFLSQFCYVLLALSQNVREALIIYKFLYIGGCFLPLTGLLLVFSICDIEAVSGIGSGGSTFFSKGPVISVTS